MPPLEGFESFKKAIEIDPIVVHRFALKVLDRRMVSMLDSWPTASATYPGVGGKYEASLQQTNEGSTGTRSLLVRAVDALEIVTRFDLMDGTPLLNGGRIELGEVDLGALLQSVSDTLDLILEQQSSN